MREREREGRLQREVERVIVGARDCGYARVRAKLGVLYVQVDRACLQARVHFALPLAF